MPSSLSISNHPAGISCDHWLELLDELNIGAFTVNLDHKITAINHCAQALIGLRDDEVLGGDCREIFTGVPCMVECLLGSAQASGFSGAANVCVKDENQKTYLITRMATPIFDRKGKPGGCLTILQDHSPVNDLIEKLRYEERRLKNILDSLEEGVFTISRGGSITFFNTAAERLSGYNRRQLLGQHYHRLYENRRGCAALLADAMAAGKMYHGCEGRLVGKDGDIIPIRATYAALRDEKGRIIGGLSTFQDMTLVRQLAQVTRKEYSRFDMIGKSPQMQKIFDMLPVVCAGDVTVLIEGATGTGKDLLAKIIHANSPRAAKPWVKINCAAIPESLIESEIFGYVKGAFTGADRDKPGRFQEAAGGTIFLDEIGDLPLSLQAKLLRVLEDREFYPLGGRHTCKVDVRIISATNRGLAQLVKAGQFRADLFYRLNVVRIDLPPLSERQGDLPLIIRHCLRTLCAARGLGPPVISESAMHILLNYQFPGNVRELENILEHALILGRNGLIDRQDLPDYVEERTLRRHEEEKTEAQPVCPNYDDPEVVRITRLLEMHRGSRVATAAALGIDRTTLWRKMKKLGLMG